MTATFPYSYAGPGAQHEALLYESADEFAATTTAFVLDAVENGETGLVVSSTENLDAVRTMIGDVPPHLFLVDADDWYRNPAETVGRWVGFVEGQVAKGRPLVRGVGEVMPLRSNPSSVAEWLRYESILNAVLAPVPLWVLCPYNTALLPDAVIEAARASHPTVIERGSVSTSHSYVPPGGTPTRSLHLEGRRHLTDQPVDVASSCTYVEAEARRAGLPEWQVQQLLAAAGEVVRNAFVHGTAPVFVTAWGDEESFVCQIEDRGAGIADLAAGYAPPTVERGEWGLWLARQSSDSLEVGRGPHGGAVRLTMRRTRNGARRIVPTRL